VAIPTGLAQVSPQILEEGVCTMIKKGALIALVVAISLIFAVPAFAGGGPPQGLPGGEHDRVVVYVRSQGLFFDSIVGPDLPMKGPFQKLEMGANGLETDFGPGDPGYLGGRWWLDLNNNGDMDEGDRFFSCPLLGHGSAVAP
jgi:hypothetical protein